ncbi:MAG: glycosyltransferase [Chloroflexaceae bacterium]|nr:glycosyltransferase [Chloroflexaceae bacterium]
MDRGKVPADRITVVRNGPNLKRVRLVDPDAELRKKAPTILGFVGEMGYQDGVDYLLRALRYLLYDMGRTDFYCVMVGQGDAWEELKELAKELGIADHMWFTGRIPDADLMRYLSTADVCVAPDPKNDFTDRSTMIKVMEFMTLSKPLVAFDLTEHRNSAQDAALYATPNEEQDFARKIAQLMDDRRCGARWGRMVESALKSIWRGRIRHKICCGRMSWCRGRASRTVLTTETRSPDREPGRSSVCKSLIK